MTDDVVFLTPGRELSGLVGFRDSFATAHRQARIACESELEEVSVVGEMAYTRSRDALSMTPHAGGDTTRLAGHRFTIYRKRADGRWLLARDAHTLVPSEAPET